mmetsp:Transcript_33475/g.80080  ORF Transcript_33475/g.80080 Transcript_33475/m.80080 type:complete len:83 (+) Transcript_33475:1078-1326(+)
MRSQSCARQAPRAKRGETARGTTMGRRRRRRRNNIPHDEQYLGGFLHPKTPSHAFEKKRDLKYCRESEVTRAGRAAKKHTFI